MANSSFIKAFTCLSRQKYFSSIKVAKKGIIDNIMFGNYDPKGQGCEYEASMDWISIDSLVSPHLSLFNDAFKLLSEHRHLMDKLSELNNKDFTPDEFSRLLIELGYTDMSDYRLP